MNLLKLLAVIGSITAFSRIIGYIRDAIIAKIFGTGIETDAFFVAFKLPNLLRNIFAEGAFSQSFIPILVEYKSQKNKKKTRLFISYISGLLMLSLFIVIIIGVLLAPWIITLIAPGFTNVSDNFILAKDLLQVLFPYIFLISLASLSGSILNVWGNFSIPALSPILLNITMIGFSLLATSLFYSPIMALAWSVVIGGILQLIYQLPYLKKIDMLVIPRLQLNNFGVLKVLRLMGPAIFGMSVNQISLVINTIFASFLVSGSVSWIYYADRLMEFPSGVLGVTLGNLLIPLLSQSFSNGDHDEYLRLMDWGLRLCLMLALPSSVALLIIAKPLIVTLFQYGKFTNIDSMMTHSALVAYSIGLIGLIVVKVLAPGFYSNKNIKTPVCIAILTLIATQLMNFIFIGPLKHAGLSLSIGLGSCLNASLLYWQLYRQKLFKPKPGWFKFFLKLILAVVAMAIVLCFLLMIFPDWEKSSTIFRFLNLIGVVSIGMITYFLTLVLVGFRLKDFLFLAK